MTTAAVIGASGFVGRRLVRGLSGGGVEVRALVRRPGSAPAGAGVVEHVVDLDDTARVADALRGSDAAYYLVHAMAAGPGFDVRDRRHAEHVASAIEKAGVGRVVYLGGPGPASPDISAHLRSRREVGDILRRRCAALVARAGIVLGTGSASFEIMRDLVRRLPVMTAPRWVESRCQPVHVDDAVETLVRALAVPGDREVDIAGPDVLTYREMLERLGPRLGRHPRILPVPVLTPALSARWLRFVTSADLNVARALVDSLRHDALSSGPDLCAEVGIVPVGFDAAVTRILDEERAAAPRPMSVARRWDEGRYHLIQPFIMPTTTADCGPRLVERLDVALLDAAASSFPAVRRSAGGLRLGPMPLIRLGEAHAARQARSARVRRAIDGGLLCRRPGGSVGFDCREADGAVVVDAVLDGYAPLLPRPVYRLTQEPFHRRVAARAVAAVAREPS